MPTETLSRFRYAWQEGNYPLTKWLIAVNVATFVATMCGLPVGQWLDCVVPGDLLQPWRLLTYPFLTRFPDILNLVFYGLMLYQFGGSLERSWGTRFYAGYFFTMGVITALGMAVGGYLFHRDTPVFNMMPIAALLVAWCMLNPTQEILFFFFPIQARWLAIFEVLFIFFGYAMFHPLMGFFALSGCAASYGWVRTRAWSGVSLYSSMPYTPRVKTPKVKRAPRDDAFSWRDLNPFERIARARRKKQFQRLFEDDEK